jgi:hypothetical protein
MIFRPTFYALRCVTLLAVSLTLLLFAGPVAAQAAVDLTSGLVGHTSLDSLDARL